MTGAPSRLYGADLHLHTVYSDGLYTPEELARTAAERRLRAVAVTDHDAVGGVGPTREAAAESGVEVVPGIEFGTPHGFREIHILGLFIDPSRPAFREALERIRAQRRRRTVESVRRLGRMGVYVNLEEILEDAAPGSPGRWRLAKALCEAGVVPSVNAAFQRYLGNGMPAYVPRSFPTGGEAIEIIHAAGGLAVMAHPRLTALDDEIPRLAEAGLDGVEVAHPAHPASAEERYRRLCALYGLLPSAGTDCHGRGVCMMGRSRLSDGDFDRLCEAADARR